MTLHVKNVLYRYHDALDTRAMLNIDLLQLNQGEQALIIGGSASGKTTLMEIFAGVRQPTAGAVWLRTHSLYRLLPVDREKLTAKNIGYMPQRSQLHSELTLLENVELPMLIAGKFPMNLARARAKALLGQVGLLSDADRYPSEISEERRKYVAAAKTIAAMPRLILSDEPLMGVNQTDGHFVLDFLQEMAKWYNATLVVTTRNPVLASRFERVFYLADGKLEELEHLTHRKLAPFANNRHVPEFWPT